MKLVEVEVIKREVPIDELVKCADETLAWLKKEGETTGFYDNWLSFSDANNNGIVYMFSFEEDKRLEELNNGPIEDCYNYLIEVLRGANGEAYDVVQWDYWYV